MVSERDLQHVWEAKSDHTKDMGARENSDVWEAERVMKGGGRERSATRLRGESDHEREGAREISDVWEAESDHERWWAREMGDVWEAERGHERW